MLMNMKAMEMIVKHKNKYLIFKIRLNFFKMKGMASGKIDDAADEV